MCCPEDCARFVTTASVIRRPKPIGCAFNFTPACPYLSALPPRPNLLMWAVVRAAPDAEHPLGCSCEFQVFGERAALRRTNLATQTGTRRFQPPWPHDLRAFQERKNPRMQPPCPRRKNLLSRSKMSSSSPRDPLIHGSENSLEPSKLLDCDDPTSPNRQKNPSRLSNHQIASNTSAIESR